MGWGIHFNKHCLAGWCTPTLPRSHRVLKVQDHPGLHSEYQVNQDNSKTLSQLKNNNNSSLLNTKKHYMQIPSVSLNILKEFEKKITQNVNTRNNSKDHTAQQAT